MPRPSQAAKDAAFRSQERATSVAIASGPAAAGGVLIPGAGPFIALGITAVGAAFGLRALLQGRIVHDPPRTDYTSATTVPHVRFDTTIFGSSAVEVSAAELIRANDETAGALEAMVLALERASGAELAHDQPMLDARSTEAHEFALMASRGLRESSERTGPFREALDELRPEILSHLEAAGFPLTYMPPVTDTPPQDPILELSAAVGQAAESDYAFALTLRELVESQALLQPGTT